MLGAMQTRAELYDVLKYDDYEAKYDELFLAGSGTQK
jgi:2-methylisocitrate lyase-like PEP mutase family enzyme